MTQQEKLVHGSHGEALVVLSRPEIRQAQRVAQAAPLMTADGRVTSRPGDVRIRANNEEYPIKAEVFYGTYEVLGSVGEEMIVRRLMHTRRAWPITSDDAIFSYGPGRGDVAIARGGWMYQSDNDDLGVINSDAHRRSHAVVGPECEQAAGNWTSLFRFAATALTFLPALLTALGLAAFVAYAVWHDHSLSKALLALETILLLAGAGLLYWMRRQRWMLRAAVQEGSRLELAFQCAVRLLGHRASDEFPGMALWRAAQSPQEGLADLHLSRNDPEVDADLTLLKSTLGKERAALLHEFHAHHRTEQVAMWAGLASLALICTFNAWLVFLSHSVSLEVMVVWLPSLIAALHAHNHRRQVTQRASGTGDLLAELQFVSERILADSAGGSASLHADAQARSRLAAALAVLCKTIGVHTQARWRFALAAHPQLPV